jgi:hypothetical protein
MNYIFDTAVIAAATLLVVGLDRAVRTYLKFRGNRIVSCPATHEAAAVRVAAGDAALKATLGHQHLKLSECSRWPENETCGQACLQQIEETPKACLAWTIVNQWYEGKECAYCHKPFSQMHWHDHPPALVNAERKTVQWNEIPTEKLQEAMRTHLPVCWNCHVAETFRREHPELVVDRAQDSLRLSVYK